MNFPRWIIADTGDPEDGVSVSHNIMEYDKKEGSYFILASVYSRGAADVVMEALYWHEQLHQGIPTSTGTLSATKRDKKKKVVTATASN